MRRVSVFVLGLVLMAGCAAIRQQKAQAAKADNLEFHNLKVLSPNITHDELIATMRGFSRSLGTRCEHCHVVTATQPKQVLDFASDAKPEKSVARTMILMTRNINGQYISTLPRHEETPQTVSCSTCHRGHTTPEPWTPPAPPAPPAAPPT
jgi:hypothetical protein